MTMLVQKARRGWQSADCCGVETAAAGSDADKLNNRFPHMRLIRGRAVVRLRLASGFKKELRRRGFSQIIGGDKIQGLVQGGQEQTIAWWSLFSNQTQEALNHRPDPSPGLAARPDPDNTKRKGERFLRALFELVEVDGPKPTNDEPALVAVAASPVGQGPGREACIFAVDSLRVRLRLASRRFRKVRRIIGVDYRKILADIRCKVDNSAAVLVLDSEANEKQYGQPDGEFVVVDGLQSQRVTTIAGIRRRRHRHLCPCFVKMAVARDDDQ
ncbi:hypothetical protein R3P38DRAFT_2776382 [Favolaschia claudopus]|uniref:Uncharacterized protein n=1 Tax=Favolaschia claudopus TaxID=2862362 RepID=A0AAW0BRD8_9AGAR